MLALGLSLFTVLLTTLNFGLREIRQENSANNRALNGRVDTVNTRIDSHLSPDSSYDQASHSQGEAP